MILTATDTNLFIILSHLATSSSFFPTHTNKINLVYIIVNEITLTITKIININISQVTKWKQLIMNNKMLFCGTLLLKFLSVYHLINYLDISWVSLSIFQLLYMLSSLLVDQVVPQFFLSWFQEEFVPLLSVQFFKLGYIQVQFHHRYFLSSWRCFFLEVYLGFFLRIAYLFWILFHLLWSQCMILSSVAWLLLQVSKFLNFSQFAAF